MKTSSKFLVAFLAVFTLMLSGCDSITQTLFSWGPDDETEYDYDYEYDAELSATDTLNSYTDLINEAQTQISYLEDSVSYADYDLTNYDPSYGVSFTCYFEIYDREALYEATMNPVGLEDAEAEELKAQAVLIFNTIDEIDTLCKDLHKYVAAQEYKSDITKGQTLVQSLYDAMDIYYDAHDMVLEKVDTLYDKYSTWEVDPNDPLSVGIDNMNKDLEQAELILDLVEDAYVNEVYTRGTELQGLYDALSAQVASHTGTNMPAIDSMYSYNIETFYDDMELTFLPNTQVAIRAINEQNADDIYTAYYNILDYYNYMIDSYNYFLDSTGY